MKKWLMIIMSIVFTACFTSAQSVIDRWDFNVADGAINTQGSTSDLGAGGITWPDKSVAKISNNTAVFFGDGINSLNNYFASASGLSVNQNETSGKYQISFDIVSADFANTAAKNQQATWGIGFRAASGDDCAVRLTYEGRLNVTNVNSAGVSNILANADQFQLSFVDKDFVYATSIDFKTAGSSLANLNVRQVYDLDAGTYDIYYTLVPAAETLLYSGSIPDAFTLSEFRIASQQFNGSAIWEAGDILAVDNIELTQLVAPIVDDGLDLIEQWDFSADSLVGENGNDFPDLAPSIWNDVAGDDALTFDPLVDQYRTENMTITPGDQDIYISWKLNSWDLSEMGTASSAYFGLEGIDNVGVELYNDISTNVWAAVRVGNTKVVKARVAKGILTGTGPLQITARLDFVNNEVQLFVSNFGGWENWTGVQWADVTTIANEYTASLDLSAVLSSGNFIQARMAATGLATSEQVTVDQVFIKEAPATGPITVSIVKKVGATYGKNLGVTTLGTFADARPNDVFVVIASGSNKNHLQSNAVSWVSSDGGIAGTTQYFTQNSVGIWYASVTAGGTFDASFTIVDNYTTIGAYLVRADSGDPLQVDTQGKYLAKSISSTSAALTYSFGAASDGVVIESVSTAAQPGAAPDTVLINYSNSGKREIGSGDFSNTTMLNTSWTIGQSTALGNVGLGGIAIYADLSGPDTPASLYNDWLSGEGHSSNTNLLEDADGDGVNNLVDYAIGGVANLPVGSEDSAYLQYVHIQLDDTEATARGLSYVVEMKNDLTSAVSWSTTGIEFVGSAADTPVAGYLTVTNRIPMTDTEKFLRLKVQFINP